MTQDEIKKGLEYAAKVTGNGVFAGAYKIITEQEREIEKLKEENKQAKIDVLNKVMNYINNKIENDYGDMSDSVKYITINIDDFDDFMDELINEVQNDTN